MHNSNNASFKKFGEKKVRKYSDKNNNNKEIDPRFEN